MDEMRWYDLFDRRPTRRDFLRVSRDVATCVALASMPASAAPNSRLRESPFTFGVASGDPRPDGVVIWTRLTLGPGARALPVRWEVALDDGFKRIVRRGTSAAPRELGHSVHAEVTGLGPGRHYWYRFNAGGHPSPAGRTRTAPAAADANERLRLAFASCQHYEHGYFTAYRHLAAEDLDVIVHLGDYIYEKSYPAPVWVRNHEGPEVVTLDQYRARYACYRADVDLQAAHASAPWIVTTDDHEVANNYAGDVPSDGPPSPAFLLRRAAAYQAYYEFMPLRRSSLPGGPAMRVYRSLSFGTLARCHVLDSRQYRSDQPCGDGGKPRCPEALAAGATMLGPAQEQWLDRELRQSRTRWNLLANQVMIAELQQPRNEQMTYSMDRWDGYVAARDRLLASLAGSQVSNPLVLTGDIHSNWVADLKRDFADPRSATIGTEFVGTSISSGGDGTEGPADRAQAANPHIKFYNGKRGYVRLEITPDRCTADYRIVPIVTRPESPVVTRATFVVENGRPGAVKAG